MMTVMSRLTVMDVGDDHDVIAQGDGTGICSSVVLVRMILLTMRLLVCIDFLSQVLQRRHCTWRKESLWLPCSRAASVMSSPVWEADPVTGIPALLE